MAALAGFLLKLGGDYAADAVATHQYLGFALAGVTVLLFVARRWLLVGRLQTPAVLVVGILLVATGHLGGNLTHGEEYLTQPIYAMVGKTPGKKVRPPITNVNEALVYQDLVEPVLEQKCWQCHSSRKQKGKLRLDTEQYVLKGGEEGKVVIAGNAEKSELYARLILPEDHKDVMPPKGKTPLTEAEVQLIHWWITAGQADFTKKVGQVPKDQDIEAVIAEVSKGGAAGGSTAAAELPAVTVGPAKPEDIQKLQQLGVVLMPVAKGSTFLMANLVNAKKFSDATMPLLVQLRDQLVWLDMSETNITDKGLQQLSQFKNLTRLSLDNTAVTDASLKHLTALPHLRYLNLYGTKVTDNGLKSLAACKNLKALYLWQTAVTPQGVAALQKAGSKDMEINFGAPSDTTSTL
jgi:mono/diheme cytochrome c family protein